MVAEKHHVDSAKASALGMLSPAVGMAALGEVLGGLTSPKPAAGVRGAAGAVYWQKLLANVKPVPNLFKEVMQKHTDAEVEVGNPILALSKT